MLGVSTMAVGGLRSFVVFQQCHQPAEVAALKVLHEAVVCQGIKLIEYYDPA